MDEMVQFFGCEDGSRRQWQLCSVKLRKRGDQDRQLYASFFELLTLFETLSGRQADRLRGRTPPRHRSRTQVRRFQHQPLTG